MLVTRSIPSLVSLALSLLLVLSLETLVLCSPQSIYFSRILLWLLLCSFSTLTNIRSTQIHFTHSLFLFLSLSLSLPFFFTLYPNFFTSPHSVSRTMLENIFLKKNIHSLHCTRICPLIVHESSWFFSDAWASLSFFSFSLSPFFSLHPQLRAVRAFKSTLDEMEERRSIHSLHSLRTSRSHPGPRPLYDISYIDEEGGGGTGGGGGGGGGFGGKITPARDSPPPPNQKSNSHSSASSERDQLLVKETNSGQMERSRSAPFNNLTQGENEVKC